MTEEHRYGDAIIEVLERLRTEHDPVESLEALDDIDALLQTRIAALQALPDDEDDLLDAEIGGLTILRRAAHVVRGYAHLGHPSTLVRARTLVDRGTLLLEDAEACAVVAQPRARQRGGPRTSSLLSAGFRAKTQSGTTPVVREASGL